jgi:ssDNA-binding replication factor A large subunit
MDSYNQLVERIAGAANLPKEEIERKVEAKRAKLSGLVSKEGAAQIVAAELGINFEKEKMKISELVQGMKKANVTGKVISLFPVRSYSKNGKDGKVANLTLADASGNMKTVLWDTNHISLIEKGEIKEGTVVEISNGQVRNGEIHLGSFSDIKISREKMDDVVTEKVFSSKSIKDIKSGQGLKTRAVIVQMYEPRYFEVCPECGKRVLDNECKIHGKVEPKKRALLNIVLDDGSDSIRATLFGEQIYNIGFTEEEVFDIDKFLLKKNDVLGEELIFAGNIRNNSFSNSNELNIEGVEKVNVQELLKELENN